MAMTNISVRLTDKAVLALAELGMSLESFIYEYLELPEPEPAAEASCMTEYSGLAIVHWLSEDASWYALAPCHPYLCSTGADLGETLADCKHKIDSLLAERALSKTEVQLPRKVKQGYTAMLEQPGRAGIALLANSLMLTASAYSKTDKEHQDSAFLLACVLAVQDSAASAKSKDWAVANMAKYLCTSDAIEQMIREAQ